MVGGALAHHILGRHVHDVHKPEQGAESVHDIDVTVLVNNLTQAAEYAKRHMPTGRGRCPDPAVEFVVAGCRPDMTREEQDAYFAEALEWIIKCAGPYSMIAAAAIHRHETSPHMQVLVVPVGMVPEREQAAREERDGKVRYRYKSTGRLIRRLGWTAVRDGFSPGKGRSADRMSRMQDHFFREVASHYGLERGEVGSQAVHEEIDRAMAARAKAEKAEAEAEVARTAAASARVEEAAARDAVGRARQERERVYEKAAARERIVAQRETHADHRERELDERADAVKEDEARVDHQVAEVKRREVVVAERAERAESLRDVRVREAREAEARRDAALAEAARQVAVVSEVEHKLERLRDELEAGRTGVLGRRAERGRTLIATCNEALARRDAAEAEAEEFFVELDKERRARAREQVKYADLIQMLERRERELRDLQVTAQGLEDQVVQQGRSITKERMAAHHEGWVAGARFLADAVHGLAGRLLAALPSVQSILQVCRGGSANREGIEQAVEFVRERTVAPLAEVSSKPPPPLRFVPAGRTRTNQRLGASPTGGLPGSGPEL